jgi:hypothetical protein
LPNRLIRQPAFLVLARPALTCTIRIFIAAPLQHVCQHFLNAFLASRIGDFVAGQVGDIERVDHLLAEGGDVRGMDVEFEVGQCACDLGEQTGAIEAFDLDNRELVGERVGNRHLRLDDKRRFFDLPRVFRAITSGM